MIELGVKINMLKNVVKKTAEPKTVFKYKGDSTTVRATRANAYP